MLAGGLFKVEIAEGIAEVTLLGPGKGNAMGPAFWRECPEVFSLNDEEELIVDDAAVTEGLRKKIENAARSCPRRRSRASRTRTRRWS